MNKEVNYVLQGFLLTLAVIGAFKFGGLLLSIPPPEKPDEASIGYCGNAERLEPEPALQSTALVTGKAIFQDNCASCHSMRKDLTGPALAGALKRVPNRKLLYKWIRNPSAVLQSGNVYFNTLKQRFGGAVMTSFNNLTDEEINAVLMYIDLYSVKAP